TNDPDPLYEWTLGDRVETLFQSDLVPVWTAALSSSRSYDVIVLGLEGWNLLPQTLQSKIQDRVSAGNGLVVIRRGPADASLAKLLPLEVVDTSDYWGPFVPADDRTV